MNKSLAYMLGLLLPFVVSACTSAGGSSENHPKFDETEFVCPAVPGCWKYVSVSSGHPKNLFIQKPDPNYLKNGKENLWLSCDKSPAIELPKAAEVCTPNTDPKAAPCGKLVCRRKK
jgi:hypothetical protein